MNRLPDFVIIGAMKCGTSTLHDQLAAQPGVFMSHPKEPNFFSDDAVYARGLDWYGALFAAAAPGDLCGESSTHYTKRPTHPQAAARLRAALPEARLIYLMRHPIDRLISHYVHEWTENRVRGSIDRAAQDHPGLIDYGLYAMQLEPYLDAYGPERILPLFLERMNRHPQETLEQVGRFLGLSGPLVWRAELAARNVGAERLRKSALRRLLTDTPGLRELRRALIPKAWRQRVRALWQMRDRPQLSPDVEARLRDRFDADLERLGTWLGLPLCCASWKDVVTAAPAEWGGARA